MTDDRKATDRPTRPVGYGNPPEHTRFKPGNRANPLGRGARSRSDFADDVEKTLSARVEVRENGRRRKMTRGEANVMALMDKAKRGDLSASGRLLDLHEAATKRGAGSETVIEVFNLPPDDDARISARRDVEEGRASGADRREDRPSSHGGPATDNASKR